MISLLPNQKAFEKIIFRHPILKGVDVHKVSFVCKADKKVVGHEEFIVQSIIIIYYYFYQ
jgi:hypothetical protein